MATLLQTMARATLPAGAPAPSMRAAHYLTASFARYLARHSAYMRAPGSVYNSVGPWAAPRRYRAYRK